jgi:hypothetical protein
MLVMDSASWAAWAGVIVTGGGFGLAVWQLAASRKDNRVAEQRRRDDETERRLAMARAVAVKVMWKDSAQRNGTASAQFTLLNSSPFPISGVRVDLPGDGPGGGMQIVVGSVLPGEEVVETYEIKRESIPFSSLTSGVTAHFTDVYGTHWARTPRDIEERPYPAPIC